jgi:hypothetical protein
MSETPLGRGGRPLLQGGERLRQRAERPRGGGGDKFLPFTPAEAAARLSGQAAAVRSAAAALPNRLRTRDVIVEATLMTNFLANSYFPSNLLNYIEATSVGTRYAEAPARTRRDPKGTTQAPTKSLFVAADDAALGRLEALLANPTAGRVPKGVRDDLQVLERLTLPTADDRLRANPLPVAAEPSRQKVDDPRDLLPVLEAVLHPSSRGRRPAAAEPEAIRKWIDLVEMHGGRVETDWLRVVGDLTFVPIRLDPTAQIDVAAFNALRSMHAMPVLREPGAVDRAGIDALPVPQLADASADGEPLRVAVFDGGCDDSSPYYAGRVREIVLGQATSDPRALRHGALVTSALLYGHAPTPPLQPANMQIDHYRVLPTPGQPGVEMYWLLDLIKEQVEAGSYDVVSVSLGPRRAFEADLDRWTSELDDLAHRKNVLFVVATGNDGASLVEELRRVQIPGDMVNGLTVGSCDDQQPTRRATYSSYGPGRAGSRVQPAGVAFGGTMSSPFLGLDADGAKLQDCGTSYAAPLVVHGLADLAQRTGPEVVNPVAQRAFVLHFAEPCAKTEETRHVGHGRLLSSYEEVLECDANEVHLLYRGTIGRTEYVPLVLPLPDSISGRIGLRWTLVTSVETDPSDDVEYAKAGLEVVFRPHARKRTYTKQGSQAVVLDATAPSQRARAEALIAQGYTASQEPSSEAPKLSGREEAALREEGKWETVRRAVTKRYNSGRLYRPRLDLSHIAREGGVLAHRSTDLSYALLVTLVAGNGVSLYDEVRVAFPVLVPITATVSVTATAT